MPTLNDKRKRLPGQFEALARILPPQAIMTKGQYHNMLEMVDRLMAATRLTKAGEHYLETLVQLVQAYEAQHHAIDVSGKSGIDALRHLLEENQISASGLADLLGLHPSMGSKLLQGERSLTVEHIKTLAARFKVNPAIFVG